METNANNCDQKVTFLQYLSILLMVKCSCKTPHMAHMSPAEKPQQRLDVFSIQSEKKSIYAP